MICSAGNAQIKELVRLQKSARHRKKGQLFVAEGMKLTREAAGSGYLEKVYVSEQLYGEMDAELEKLLSEYPSEVVSGQVFRKVSETVVPQGVLALVRMPSYSLTAVMEDRRRSFLLLDGLRDPGNLGTVMRTAEGAGMSGVILGRGSADLFNPKTVRSTMGSIFRMPFYDADCLPDVVLALKAKGLPVYGAMMDGGILYHMADYRMGAGIVVGNEANGISPEVAECLTGSVRIPMEGKLESLNAAVSAAILMYGMARQRDNERSI